MPTNRGLSPGSLARLGSSSFDLVTFLPMSQPTLRANSGSADPAAVPDRRFPRWWIPLLTSAVVVSGMAYGLWWPPVVRHTSWYWLEPGDIWLGVRSAHWIGWGGFSYIYSSKSYLVTLPGFDIFLTPVVMLSSKLGLSETAPGFLPVAKPTAWLLVGPLTLACSGLALYGLDRLARAVGVSVRRRQVLGVLEAAAMWPTVALWGHPEDVLAVGLVALALEQALSDHWTASAWFMGGALCMQLYTIGVVPVLLGLAGMRRSGPWLVRAAVLPGALLLAVLIPNPHATLHALLQQPNYPRTDYPTPWVLLAPKLGGYAVANGPSHIIGFVGACGLGILAARVRRNPVGIVWLLGAALAIRCLFEAVMDPYYVAPGIAFVLVAVAGERWIRVAFVTIASAGLIELTYFRPGMWVYWLEMAAVTCVLFFVALPGWRLSSAAPKVAPTTDNTPFTDQHPVTAGLGSPV